MYISVTALLSLCAEETLMSWVFCMWLMLVIILRRVTWVTTSPPSCSLPVHYLSGKLIFNFGGGTFQTVDIGASRGLWKPCRAAYHYFILGERGRRNLFSIFFCNLTFQHSSKASVWASSTVGNLNLPVHQSSNCFVGASFGKMNRGRLELSSLWHWLMRGDCLSDFQKKP